MQKFKFFIKKKIKHILIDAEPVHGSHAKHDASKEKPKEIKEATQVKHVLDHLNSTINANKHIGADVEAVHEAMTQDQNFEKHVSKTGQSGLRNYTDNSRDINNYLIDKAKGVGHNAHLSDEHAALIKKYGNHENPDSWKHREALEKVRKIENSKAGIKNIDSAFDHKAKRKHDVYAFHGCGYWHPGKEAAKHPERLIHMPAYTSSSINGGVAAGFANEVQKKPLRMTGRSDYVKHVLKIHVKPEHKAVYLGDNSLYPEESEMLIHRGTNLKIHPTPTVLHNSHELKRDKTNRRTTYVWHASIEGQHDDK